MAENRSSTDQVTTWVAAAQAGDSISLSALYRRFVGPIYRYAYWQTQDQAAAEDITSQTFLIMVQKIQTFRSSGSFKNWLYTIAKRQLYRWLRDKYRLARLEEYHSLVPDTDQLISPDPDIAEQTKAAAVEQALASLTKQEKQVLRCRYQDQLSVKETASKLKLSSANVKVIAHRAKRKLRTK